MLTLDDLDQDQIDAIDHCFEHDATFLVAGMGAGKTIIALTCAEELLAAEIVDRVLVIAPLRVCNKVWRAEHLNWEHTRGLNVQVMTGDDRILDPAAQIVVVNFDILPWFDSLHLFKHFDALIIDEAGKLAAGGAQFKCMRRHVKDFKWRLVMNGTPVSEGWHKAFYQIFLTDAGATFGKNKQDWLDKYFYPTDFKRYRWAVKPGQEPRLASMIKHLVYVVPDYRDSLPPFTVELVPAPLPPVGWEHYKSMAGTMKTAGVTAKTAGVKSNKLSQIVAGFIYGEPEKKGGFKKTIKLHDGKEKVFDQIFGNFARPPILIVYQYTAELAQLRARHPDLAILADDENYLDDWCAGRLNALAFHARSAGHGLNLAAGGHELLWLSPPWSKELFDQTNARLWRRGQLNPVRARVLFSDDTIDAVIWERQGEKSAFTPAFIAHLAEVAQIDAPD